MKTIIEPLSAARIGVVIALLGVTPLIARQAREHDAGWSVPPEAARRVNPLASRPGAEAGGRKLFQQRCAICHKEDERGTPKGPDLTQADVQSQTDGALFWKIGSGNTHEGMPAFSFLPAPQRWQLVLHLRAIAVLSPEPRNLP